MNRFPVTKADLPTEHSEIIKYLFRRLVGTCDFHAVITSDQQTCLGEWLEDVIQKDKFHFDFPGYVPSLPPLPPGFSRWVYRGIAYASPTAIMVTSWDETEDLDWDPPAMFKTDGDAHTHYAEAVIEHHEICKCAQCIPF